MPWNYVITELRKQQHYVHPLTVQKPLYMDNFIIILNRKNFFLFHPLMECMKEQKDYVDTQFSWFVSQGPFLFCLVSYFDTNIDLIYSAHYSLVISQITCVKIPDQLWMTQRGQDTDLIFQIFSDQSLSSFQSEMKCVTFCELHEK